MSWDHGIGRGIARGAFSHSGLLGSTFLYSGLAFVVGYDITNGSGAQVWVSDDGFESFSQEDVITPISGPLAGFWSPNTVATDGAGKFFVALSDKIFRTEDNGDTWTNITPPSATFINYVSYAGSYLTTSDFSNTYYSSDGGDTWATAISSFSANKVIYDGTNYIAIGSAAIKYATAITGTWNNATESATGEILDVAHNGSGVLIAVTDDREILKSTDNGVNWTGKSPAGSGSRLHSVAYGNEFVIVGYSEVQRSTDAGESWTQSNTGNYLNFQIVWDGAQYVVAANDYSDINEAFYRTSSNGSSWSEAITDTELLTDVASVGLAYDASTDYFLYVAASDVDILEVQLSQNGSTWSNTGLGLGTGPLSSPLSFIFYDYNKSVFVASDVDSKLYKSSNLTNWEFVSIGNGYSSLYTIWLQPLDKWFALVGKTLAVSVDLVSWYDAVSASGAGGFNWVTCSDDGMIVVAVGEGVDTFSTTGIAYSLDGGLNWDYAAVDELFYDVVYYGGVFVAVGANGAIYTSTDGSSWTSRTSNITAHIYNVVHDGEQFIAYGGNDGELTVSTDGTTWTASTYLVSVWLDCFRYAEFGETHRLFLGSRGNNFGETYLALRSSDGFVFENKVSGSYDNAYALANYVRPYTEFLIEGFESVNGNNYPNGNVVWNEWGWTNGGTTGSGGQSTDNETEGSYSYRIQANNPDGSGSLGLFTTPDIGDPVYLDLSQYDYILLDVYIADVPASGYMHFSVRDFDSNQELHTSPVGYEGSWTFKIPVKKSAILDPTKINQCTVFIKAGEAANGLYDIYVDNMRGVIGEPPLAAYQLSPPVYKVGCEWGEQPSGSAIEVFKPANVLDGDILIACVASDDTTNGFGLPTGFTSIQATTDAGTSSSMRVGYKIASSEGASYSFETGDSGSEAGEACIIAFRGQDSGTPIQDTNNGSTSTTVTSKAFPTFSTDKERTLVIGVMASGRGTNKATFPAGWIPLFNNQYMTSLTTTAASLHVACYQQEKKGTTNNGSLSVPNSTTLMAVTFGIRVNT